MGRKVSMISSIFAPSWWHKSCHEKFCVKILSDGFPAGGAFQKMTYLKPNICERIDLKWILKPNCQVLFSNITDSSKET